MPKLSSNSVDMVLCDLPYGTTPLKWDSQLDIKELWAEYRRIVKPNGAIILFGQEPFSSFVRLSNIKEYKYDWYWEKPRLTNVFQVKYRCGKTVENIMVFYRKQCTYNPQKSEHLGKPMVNRVGENARFSETQSGERAVRPLEYKDDGTRHPTQVIRFGHDNLRKRLHPTQKPLALCEYLIKTYTNEGDTVLDNCMGSGTTGVACKNLNRNFIGIELNKEYYRTAVQRINGEGETNEDTCNTRCTFEAVDVQVGGETYE